MKKSLLLLAALLLPSMRGYSVDEDRKMTRRGKFFHKVKKEKLEELEINVDKFGEAWMDPDKVIWGDVIKYGDEVKYFTLEAAAAYCEEIGAELPTRDDFIRLVAYTTNDLGLGYSPDILPNLFQNKPIPSLSRVFTQYEKVTNHFLSSTKRSSDSYQVFVFSGLSGTIFETNSLHDNVNTARCVYHPQQKS